MQTRIAVDKKSEQTSSVKNKPMQNMHFNMRPVIQGQLLGLRNIQK